MFEMWKFREHLKQSSESESNEKSESGFFGRLAFPESVVREVHSWIVENEEWNCDQKYLALIDKYIMESAEMSVNIGFLCRQKLVKLTDAIIDDLNGGKCNSGRVKHTVFDHAIKQLFRLMTAVLDRYEQEYTIDYQHVVEDNDDNDKK